MNDFIFIIGVAIVIVIIIIVKYNGQESKKRLFFNIFFILTIMESILCLGGELSKQMIIKSLSKKIGKYNIELNISFNKIDITYLESRPKPIIHRDLIESKTEMTLLNKVVDGGSINCSNRGSKVSMVQCWKKVEGMTESQLFSSFNDLNRTSQK
jgi:hypothetical protein